MTPLQSEIAALEERLRLAELGPDAAFFEEALADDAVMLSQEAQPFTKQKIVEAHRPGKGPKFTRVTMSGMTIVEQGSLAIVTCLGAYEGPQFTGTLKFMRVWLKKAGRWQIVAGAVFNV